jgi:putative DNA primase/helicase
VEGAARELLATAEATDDLDERDAIDDAKCFLRNLLAEGPIPARQVEADIRGAGYALRTINRAKKLVGAESFKEGKTWFWRIVGATENIQDCQPCQQDLTRNLGNLGNLEPNQTVEVEK